MAEREVEKWITVHGKHIPIYKDSGDSQKALEEMKPLIRKSTSNPSELLVSERKQIEDFVDKHGTSQGTLYRGLDLPDYAIKDLQVGKEFPMEDRLTSFTPSKKSAEEFAKRKLNDRDYFGNNAVILKDENGVGVDITSISSFEGEKEVLVNNKGNYVITKVDKITSKHPGRRGNLEDVEIHVVTVKRTK